MTLTICYNVLNDFALKIATIIYKDVKVHSYTIVLKYYTPIRYYVYYSNVTKQALLAHTVAQFVDKQYDAVF